MYFVFSDECGAYKQERTSRFVAAHPFYCRVAVLVPAEEWRDLRTHYEVIKTKYSIPLEKEVKWSYIWSLRKAKIIRESDPYYFLKGHSPDALFEYLCDCLDLLSLCNGCKIIYTLTLNDPQRTHRIGEADVYKMHLQDIMQRVEMELQADESNLAVLFLDPVNKRVDDLLRQAYHRIYSEGDYILRYRHVKDSISFEVSHHSCGIQLADYSVGVFTSALRGNNTARELFETKILPFVRTGRAGQVFGFGIIEVPKRPSNREYLRKRLASWLRAESLSVRM